MSRKLITLVCLGMLAVGAVPLMAGQDNLRPSTLFKPNVISTAVSPTVGTAQRVTAGASGFVTIEGTRGLKTGRIPFLRFEYDVKSPRDPATGQATGKRQHSPVKIIKEWDANSPRYFQALVTNEQIKTAKFEFLRTNAKGETEIYANATLSDGAISEFRQFTGEPSVQIAARSSMDLPELEEISFTFQKIELNNLVGKTTAMDELSLAR